MQPFSSLMCLDCIPDHYSKSSFPVVRYFVVKFQYSYNSELMMKRKSGRKFNGFDWLRVLMLVFRPHNWCHQRWLAARMVQLLLCSVIFAISHKHMLLIESGFQILTFPPFVPILSPKVQPTHHASLTNKQSNAKNTDRHYRDFPW